MNFEIVKKEGWNLLNVDDLATLQKFNDKNGSTEYKIIGKIFPEPFIGNPEKANVYLLSLNPGYGGDEDIWHRNKKFIKLIFDNIELKETDFPYYYLSTNNYFAKSPGHLWCSRVFKELISAVTAQKLSKAICCIQFHGYHSKKYKSPGDILPSQKQSFDLVKSAMNRKVPIILMRSKKLWFKAINDLENYPNLILLNNPRNPTVSIGNMKEGEFNKILNSIR
jgi:hypothetical protein